MFVAGKRKYNHKTLLEKCQALKDLQEGMSDIAAKYGVPKNIFIKLDQEQRTTFRFTRKGKQH